MTARVTLLFVLGLSACSVSDDDLWGARCTLNQGSCGTGTLACSPLTLRCVRASTVTGGGGGGGGFGGGSQGGGSGGGVASCTVQPFATVDDWLPGGCSSAKGRFVSAISSPSPQVIVAGELKCVSQGLAVRSRGADGGWATLYDGQDGGPWTNPTLRGMVVSQGQIFLVGSDTDAPDGGPPTVGWRVWRKGLGPTDPMELVDSSPEGKATSVTLTPAGDWVMVAGVRAGQLVVRRWDGTNWGDAYVSPTPSGCVEEPRGITMDNLAILHVAGSRISGASSDAGCDLERPWFTMGLWNFATIWDGGFVQQSGTEAIGQGIGAQVFGEELFTIGSTTAAASEWLVRRSFDHGQSWQGSDRWRLDPAQPCAPVGLTVTGTHAWVAGACTNDAGVRSWAVRSMGVSEWSTVDLWSPAAGVAATASSVDVDGRGTVYVAGSTDLTGHWIVRSALCQ